MGVKFRLGYYCDAEAVVANDSYFKIWDAGSNTVQSLGAWT